MLFTILFDVADDDDDVTEVVQDEDDDDIEPSCFNNVSRDLIFNIFDKSCNNTQRSFGFSPDSAYKFGISTSVTSKSKSSFSTIGSAFGTSSSGSYPVSSTSAKKNHNKYK